MREKDFSKTLERIHCREIGLQEAEWGVFLLDFRMGRMRAFFPMERIKLCGLVSDCKFYSMGSQVFQVYVGDMVLVSDFRVLKGK